MFGRTRQTASGLLEFDLWGQGWARVEVAGESYRQAEIAALFSTGVTESGCELEARASLIPEPINPHDANAVRVEVDGRHVGYLSRDDAVRYRPALDAIVAAGYRPMVGARVWAQKYVDFEYDARGRARQSERLWARVTLSLAEPHLLVPLNQPPDGLYSELPQGRKVKVIGGVPSARALAPWVSSHGEGWVHVTLHPVTEQLARSSRQVVEVRLGPDTAGTLTPAMSKQYLPVLELMSGRGVTCAARALVKGNSVNAELTLVAAKASDLPEEWVQRHIYSHPTVEPPTVLPETVTGAAPDVFVNESAAAAGGRVAGWYPDEQGMADLRFWDGQGWTTRIKMG